MFRLASKFKLYEDVRHTIKTGDVVAFSGKGTICDLIRLLTNAPYSHVGLVFDVTVTGTNERNIMYAESTVGVDLDDDLRPGDVSEGVQMHFLSSRLDHYDGNAWLVPLKNPLTPAGRPDAGVRPAGPPGAAGRSTGGAVRRRRGTRHRPAAVRQAGLLGLLLLRVRHPDVKEKPGSCRTG
jgi:hypothetical protein